MNTVEKDLLMEKINEKIAEFEKTIEQLEVVVTPVSPENAIGRISRMDAIGQKSVAEASLRKAKERLANLKHALTKIDAPNFGSCARCKGKIPIPRLMFMPDSPYCVHCADK